jgi:hypothetical protein
MLASQLKLAPIYTTHFLGGEKHVTIGYLAQGHVGSGRI